MKDGRNDCPSRRVVLAGARLVMGAGLCAGIVSQARAQPSVTKADAQYQAMPKGQQRCGLCRHFQAPKACQVVQGEISENGWCLLFAAKS